MADAIAHRGPDDSGLHFEPDTGVGLAHRRLAIVDLSAEGHQPMVSASQRYVIVFNGEVYNFSELRRDLEQTGRAPALRGHSDTEVMLAAIEVWGLEPALERFVGMFAFALWDRTERRLSLVRDRLGVKPLYFANVRGQLLFGSELGTILAGPDFERNVDSSAVVDFLRWAYVPAPGSIYQGVHQVEPGVALHFVAPDGPAQTRRYWDCVTVAEKGMQNPLQLSESETLDRLDSSLRAAVNLRMIADVPLGAFLSGGIDSSLVVALMQAQSTQPVRTFSIGSPDSAYDEGAAAARVAAHLRTDHTSFEVSATDAFEVIPQLGNIFDQPFADPSQVPTLLVSRLARGRVTVALTGDGGDESFGGYNRHLWGSRAWQLLHLVPQRARMVASNGLRLLSPDAYASAVRVLPTRLRPRLPGVKAQKLLRAMRVSSSAEFYAALCAVWPEPDDVLASPAPQRGSSLPRVETGSFSTDMMLMDLLTYLPGDVLTKVDRSTMSVALEARSPFLDHRIVELAWRLAPRFKIRRGIGKWALRQLLYRYVPRALVDRPKMGFAVPIGAWIAGPLRDWAEELLIDARRDGIFRDGALQAAWTEHLAGRQDHSTALWSVLMFQAWLKGVYGPAGRLQSAT